MQQNSRKIKFMVTAVESEKDMKIESKFRRFSLCCMKLKGGTKQFSHKFANFEDMIKMSRRAMQSISETRVERGHMSISEHGRITVASVSSAWPSMTPSPSLACFLTNLYPILRGRSRKCFKTEIFNSGRV